MKKAKPSGSSIGIVVLLVGLAVMTWTNAQNFAPEGIARISVIVGVILICYGRIVRRTAAADDTYRLGYDIGYEAGHQEGHRLARPVVVDLDDHRCACKKKAQSSAPKVVDRV